MSGTRVESVVCAECAAGAVNGYTVYNGLQSGVEDITQTAAGNTAVYCLTLCNPRVHLSPIDLCVDSCTRAIYRFAADKLTARITRPINTRRGFTVYCCTVFYHTFYTLENSELCTTCKSCTIRYIRTIKYRLSDCTSIYYAVCYRT